jgi:hypothetical protein
MTPIYLSELLLTLALGDRKSTTSPRDSRRKSSKPMIKRLAEREITRRQHPRGDQLNPLERIVLSREMDSVESSTRTPQRNEIH